MQWKQTATYILQKFHPTGFVILVFVILAAGCANQASIPARISPAEPSPGIIFTSDRTGNWDIFLIQADGSGLRQLTDDPQVDADPDWSPDGRLIAFRSRRDGSSDIFVMGSDGSAPVNLINDPESSFDDEFAPRWNPDGETFSLYTDRYPPRMANCLGGYHQIAILRRQQNRYWVDLFETVAGEQYSSSWSPDGRYLVFNSNCRGPAFQLYLYDTQTGETKQITTWEGGSFGQPAWSHDGKFLAYAANVNGNLDIYIQDINNHKRIRLTDHPADDNMPTWSPDDKEIAFVSYRDGNDEIYILRLKDQHLTNITQHPADDWYPSWSPISKKP